MEYTQLIVQEEGEITRISLNRPDKLNALTPTMLQEWRAALEKASTDTTCRVIIINGAGRAWSAGVDLSLFQNIKIEPGFQAWEDGQEIIRLLETMPQVTLCMLNGYCFTGAMELMMAFDLIIAADEAKIGDTHTKWGIPPKWGMTQRLAHQVGLRKAKELSFTAEAISGQEAARIGLVNQSVPLADLKTTVDELAQKIIQNSQQTIAAVKSMYHYGSKHTLQKGLDFERDYQVDLTDKTDNLKNFKKEI